MNATDFINKSGYEEICKLYHKQADIDYRKSVKREMGKYDKTLEVYTKKNEILGTGGLTMAKIIGIKCKDCKSENVFILDEGQHKGIYCEDCGAWIKWANKKEVNLFKISRAKEN